MWWPRIFPSGACYLIACEHLLRHTSVIVRIASTASPSSPFSSPWFLSTSSPSPPQVFLLPSTFDSLTFTGRRNKRAPSSIPFTSRQLVVLVHARVGPLFRTTPWRIRSLLLRDRFRSNPIVGEPFVFNLRPVYSVASSREM